MDKGMKIALFTAVLALAMVIGCSAIPQVDGESHSFNINSANWQTPQTINADYGDEIYISYTLSSPDFYGILDDSVKIPGLSYSQITGVYMLQGTVSAAGTYVIKMSHVTASDRQEGSTITINVAPPEYTVTFDGNGGTPSEPSAKGVTVTLPTATKEHYVIDGWYTAAEGGTKVGDVGDTYTPTGDTTLYAHWAKAKYTVTLTSGTGGHASIDSLVVEYQTQYYVSNNELHIGNTTITAVNDTGYTFTKWYKGGSTATSGTIEGDLTFRCAFKINTYQLTYQAGEHGRVDVTIMGSVNYGKEYTINGNVITVSGESKNVTATADTGYRFVRWVLNGQTAVSGTVTSDLDFTAEFEQIVFRMKFVNSSSYGEIDKYTLDNVPYNTRFTVNNGVITFGTVGSVTATPTEIGYDAYWKIDGMRVTEGTVTSELTFTAEFAQHQYELSFKSSTGGHPDFSLPIHRTYGDTYTIVNGVINLSYDNKIKPVADDGYRFVNWTVNGQPVESGTITSDIEFVCNFERIICNLTFTVEGSIGSVDPVKMDDVAWGTHYWLEGNVLHVGDKDVIAGGTDTEGYVSKWTVNGQPVVNGEIKDSMDFTIVFEITYWTVNFTHSSGGHLTIDGDDEKTKIEFIPYGTEIKRIDANTIKIGNHTITAVADEGFVFSEFSAQGGSVTKDREIHATFIVAVDDSVTLTIRAGEHGEIRFGESVKTEFVIEVPKGIAINVTHGELVIGEYTFITLASEGYAFDKWDYPQYADRDSEITASFIKDDVKVSINVEQTVGGKVTVVTFNEDYKVTMGSTFTVSSNSIVIGNYIFTADASDGYTFAGWAYRNGGEIKTGDKAYENHLIHAVFKVAEPAKEDNKTVYLALAVVSIVAAVVTAGMAVYGYRSPIVFIIMSAAAVAAVVLMLIYFGVIKI